MNFEPDSEDDSSEDGGDGGEDGGDESALGKGMDIPFLTIWPVLRKVGWSSCSGDLTHTHFYLMPGVKKRTGVLGVTMFGTEEELAQHISDHGYSLSYYNEHLAGSDDDDASVAAVAASGGKDAVVTGGGGGRGSNQPGGSPGRVSSRSSSRTSSPACQAHTRTHLAVHAAPAAAPLPYVADAILRQTDVLGLDLGDDIGAVGGGEGTEGIQRRGGDMRVSGGECTNVSVRDMVRV